MGDQEGAFHGAWAAYRAAVGDGAVRHGEHVRAVRPGPERRPHHAEPGGALPSRVSSMIMLDRRAGCLAGAAG